MTWRGDFDSPEHAVFAGKRVMQPEPVTRNTTSIRAFAIDIRYARCNTLPHVLSLACSTYLSGGKRVRAGGAQQAGMDGAFSALSHHRECLLRRKQGPGLV